MVADLGTAHAAEKLFRPIRASAIEAVRLLMVDTLHFETAVQRIPRAAFVSMDDRARLDASLNEADSLTFRGEHGGDGIAAALAHDHNCLALAVLVAVAATV